MSPLHFAAHYDLQPHHSLAALPPMLRQYTVYLLKTALRSNPFLSVESVLISGLLRVGHRHLAWQRLRQRCQGLPVEEGAGWVGHQQGGGRDPWRKGLQVVVG